jgi:cytochrome c553
MKLIHCVPLLALPLLASTQSPEEGQELDARQAIERLLRRFDDDQDGRVSRDEFNGRPFRFRRMDRDRNGFVDLDDLPGAKQEAPAADAPPAADEALAFFEEQIRPLLAGSCYRCHSSEADKVKGGLLLDSRAGLLEGGGSGPAIVPGDPDKSLLVLAVRYADEDLEMPPKKPLAPEAVRDLERWVAMGAPWPQAVTAEALGEREHGIDIEAGKEWWSFQPPRKPDVPTPENEGWAWSEPDRFLLAEMEAHDIAPVDDADDRTWLRRVSFDLIGLPPTPEESAAFEVDRSPQRYEHVVDRLLSSRHYGERWGRHWLDVARYAESSGKDSNVVYPHAWRYRDWVIEAFDSDLAYDRFLTEQIAGDLLPAEGAQERTRQTIATGYLALGTKSHNARDKRQFAVDLADEQIDAFSQGLLGVTVACARCHDHKFDPIPTEDYYALQGIFQSSETLYGTVRGRGNRYPSDLVNLPSEASVPDGPSMGSTLRKLLERLRTQAQERLGADGSTKGPKKKGKDKSSPEPVDEDDAAGQDSAARARMRTARQALTDLESILSRFDQAGRPTAANRVAMGMREGKPRDAQLLVRGELEAAGERVPRGFPQVLRNADTPPIERGSGRRELAEWISSETNPLTARVWVNRVWLYLFGRGIVDSPNNFGRSGQPPSHPALLDWLAVTFVEEGWSTKSLIRRIVLSHAYRLASTSDPKNAKLDPEAVLLWRMPERRLDAESIRDAMLFAAGTLELERPEGSRVCLFEGQPRREQIFEFLAEPSNSRSVYLPLLRDRVPEALEVFDAADPSFVTGDREETNVATQALFLMNADEVLAAADALAARLLAHDGKDSERIALGFEFVLGRAPSAAERRAVKAFLKDYEKLATSPPEEPPASRRERRGRKSEREAQPAKPTPELAAWSAFAQALFQSAEFRYAG